MKKYKTYQAVLQDHVGESESKLSSDCSNTVVSFFAGCGGLDLGFVGGFKYKNEVLTKTSFNILAAYDIDQKCVDTYRQNIGNHIQVKDLSKADPREMPSSDVLIGGFPCQDFATCGPRKGLGSGRGRLYLAQVNYMKHFRPKLVVAENVPGLANINNGEDLNRILSDFRACGYRFEVWNLFAPDFGIPQNRTRLFLIGVRNDINGFPVQPEKTHEKSYNTIEWAIDDLINITDESVPNQSQYFKASKAKKGNGQGDEKSKIGSPSYTIRANAKSRVRFHYHLDRLVFGSMSDLYDFLKKMPESTYLNYQIEIRNFLLGNGFKPSSSENFADTLVSNILANFKNKDVSK